MPINRDELPEHLLKTYDDIVVIAERRGVDHQTDSFWRDFLRSLPYGIDQTKAHYQIGKRKRAQR